jgi:uncharacterized protein (DUF1697 family)
MPLFIALFRGINVGGSNTLPMVELVEILASLGGYDIKTIIQSGNAIFRLPEDNIAGLAEKISSAVEQHRGFTPRVLILTPEDLKRAMAGNPFPLAVSEPSSLHLGFLAAKPEHVDMDKLVNLKTESEQFQLTPNVFYLFAPNGMGRSRLAVGVEKILGVPMTDRNWKTVFKIRELVTGM